MLCNGYEVYVSSIYENGAGAGAGGQRVGMGRSGWGLGWSRSFLFPFRSGA